MASDKPPVAPRDGGVQVPSDFPRVEQGVASGAQTKFNAKFVDSRFIVGPSDEELALRYTLCAEYVDLLPPFCRQLQVTKASWSCEQILEHCGRQLAKRYVRLSGSEIDWTISKVALALGWEWSPGTLWRATDARPTRKMGAPKERPE